MPQRRDDPVNAEPQGFDPGNEPSVEREAELGPVVRMALQIGWPAFVMAGVIEALVFAVVDPNGLHWFGGERIEWPAQAVYTVSFFIFWLVIATACGISRALMTFREDVRIVP